MGPTCWRNVRPVPISPPVEAGAWFIHDVTRMDDQQHAISGLIYTADALDDRPRREPDLDWQNSGE